MLVILIEVFDELLPTRYRLANCDLSATTSMVPLHIVNINKYSCFIYGTTLVPLLPMIAAYHC